MKILLSAFAFAPHQGSEAGGAWRWALELSKRHEVFVITDLTRRPLVEPLTAVLDAAGISVIFFRPRWLQPVPLNSKTAQLLFGIWQICLLPFVKRLHRSERFDVIQHISYGVFRQASWLGFVGPAFVFGPVGGGEDAPWRLKKSLPLREKAREVARDVANRIARVNPCLRWAMGRASLVIARTEETRSCLPSTVWPRTLVAQEIGAPVGEIAEAAPWTGGTVKLLFVGRMLGLKGLHFVLGALKRLLRTGMDVRLTIVGRGPASRWIEERMTALELQAHVDLIPYLPQSDLFQLYARMHVFVFPSLHDSGGNVVLEAMSAGLPVVCLDLGGPATLVNAESAVIVSTHACSEEVLCDRLADAVRVIVGNRQSWRDFHIGALRRASEMSWSKQIGRLESKIIQIVELRQGSEVDG